jgi:hypothetical protein
MQQNNNPSLAPPVRLFTVIVALVLAGGSSLLFTPGFISQRWLWDLTPFNTRFLGAIYLTELAAIGVLVVVNRWSPARLVLPLAFIFTALVSLVSVLHLDRFDVQRLATWAWFVLYVGSAGVTAYLLWRYRRLAPADPTPPARGWQRYFQAQGGIMGFYGLGLLLLPATFSAVWPWSIDPFHAQMYSAIFIIYAAGAYILLRAAAPLEFFTLGLAQSLFGWGVILGVVIVDASMHRMDWSAWSVWVWMAAFAGLGGAGLAMIWQAWAARKRVKRGGNL